ncbi:MAG: hypothetical protein H0U52_04805 [Chloroflexi bacterium]|nr:hypothetical protein [Chloroflexota bacterium]
MALTAPPTALANDPVKYQGMLADGKTTYLFVVPPDWNGTLFLYSHGLINDLKDNAALVSQNKRIENWLLKQGFALAGGSYPGVGLVPVIPFMESQIAVLDKFDAVVGSPDRTIAWGLSLGGEITGYLVNAHSNRFDGAVAICPYRLEGSVGNFNERLDHVFVLKTLLGFDSPLVNIGFGTGQRTRFLAREIEILDTAQQTAAGRARLALAEAMVNTPQWGVGPSDTEPATDDFLTRQRNQYLIARENVFYDGERNYYEHLVGDWDVGGVGSVTGGNFSWNVGVDYGDQLARSASVRLVGAMYAAAPGIDLATDLATLASAARIAADPGAVEALQRVEPVFGDIGGTQVVTLALEADTVVWPNTVQGYGDAVATFGRSAQLRQLWVHRAGHCNFTAAEQIVAIQTLLARLDGSAWPSTAASDLNAEAIALGTSYNHLSYPTQLEGPKYSDFDVPLFLRNYNAASTNPYP